MELGRFLGSLHPALVHFPIALLLSGGGADVLAFIRRNERMAWAGLWLTLLGTGSMLFAFVCGILAEVFAARAGAPLWPMERHEWLATWTTWLFLALASFRLFMGASPKRAALAVYLLFALTGCGLLFVTAKLGGEIVYEYGGGVAGARPLRPMTLEDLATVAQHQEQKTLAYSNQMHHIFGWLVLALSVSVLCERLRIAPLANLRKLMPFIFLGGGVYLFLYSDWDSWPLSDLRPITDIEVLLHKFTAALMCGIGVGMTWRRRSLLHSQTAILSERWAWQNKLIAVMALIGGGLLFTHIHTNAPHVSNAIGVYLNHAVMGAVALAIAGAMLLEEAMPARRVVTLLFPVLMMSQAGLLLKYNEDLPWFLGYGVIDATAPGGGLLAHVPGGRAELVFDPGTGKLALSFLQAMEAKPLLLPAAPLSGRVVANRKLQSIVFQPVADNSARASRFQARAEWLRSKPLFVLQLAVPTADGRGRKWTEFDPCVTAPVLPPLVGAARMFRCPMCPDVLSSKRADCPMCAMALVETPRNNVLRKPLPLHDEGYSLELTTAPVRPRAGELTRLRFTLRRAGDRSAIKDLRVVHEKLLHLFIVNDDLSWFAHEHPEREDDSSLTLALRFLRGGNYVLFADLAPADARSQVFRLPLRVEGEAAGRQSTQDEAGIAREFDGRVVSLLTTPHLLRARAESQLTIHIEQNGRPVDDLGQFLGASGHCVIISEDTQEFLHTHAEQLTAAPPAGPELSFHASFPKAGRYKVWAQFNHRGTIVTADFALVVY